MMKKCFVLLFLMSSALLTMADTFGSDTIKDDYVMQKGIVMRLWYRDIPMCIYVPPVYWREEAKDMAFNVLYLLSGTGDDDMGWLMNGGASDILDEMYQDEEIENMIVVMPLVDSEMNGEYEKKFYGLMQFVETHMMAGQSKQRRAIAGLSIGGFHAMHIAHYYPDMFNYVGIFSAIYTLNKMEIFKKDVNLLFPSDESVPEPYRYTARDLARQFENAPKLYYIAVGKDDFLHRQNEIFRQYLDDHNYSYRYHESDGGHEWKNWKDYLTLFLPKLFRNVE